MRIRPFGWLGALCWSSIWVTSTLLRWLLLSKSSWQENCSIYSVELMKISSFLDLGYWIGMYYKLINLSSRQFIIFELALSISAMEVPWPCRHSVTDFVPAAIGHDIYYICHRAATSIIFAISRNTMFIWRVFGWPS